MSPKEPYQTASGLQKNGVSQEPSSATVSSLGIKYPALRDHPLHTGYMWLKGRRIDDAIEGLWRIHDNLYDLTDFITVHPGGRAWLELTQGTDITEAFESHHLSADPLKLLPQYFVKKAERPRNFPFTFEEDGFYRTLKRRIVHKLKTTPRSGAERSKLLTDLLMVAYVLFAVLATYFQSFSIGLVAGVVLSLTGIAAHNFFHQRDNFRMYYFDFTMMQSKEWRISHALSHHMYTNTVNDLEISSIEPFLQYLPIKKHFLFRYASWFYSPVIYAFIFIGYFARTILQNVLVGRRLDVELLLPFTVPLLASYVTGQTIWLSLLMFLWIQVTGGVYFGLVGVNAAHHHPDIFHDGDARRANMDWGVYQLDAVMDRKDITGSHFMVLTNFGDHALHHLFPTIDHGLLEHLYPVFLDTCKEFGVDWRLSSQLELVKGQFKQLANVEPNRVPPGAQHRQRKND